MQNVLAPTHTGAQPASYSVDGKLIRPLGRENDRAFELVNALSPDQQKQAILGFEVRNLVLGPGTDGKTIAPEGVRVSTFTPPQRSILLALVREWVGILDDQAARAKMAEIEAGLADTYFAWAGPTTNGKGAYFRVQGPAVFIEYAPQGNAGTPTSITFTRSIASRRTTTRPRRRGGESACRCGACRSGREPEPAAHQVDEYLQAARVSVGRTGLTREVDLTPGTRIASGIVRTIDTDADNVISSVEADTYGRDVLSDLTLELDDRAVNMTLTGIDRALGRGDASRNSARSGCGRPGMSRPKRAVTASILLNNHAPEASAYMVNALLPDERGVTW